MHAAAPAGASQTGTQPDRPRLAQACRELEGMFLAVLVKELWRTAPAGGFGSSSEGGGAFGWLWIEELGRIAADRAPVGIAEVLLRRHGGELQQPAHGGSSGAPRVPMR